MTTPTPSEDVRVSSNITIKVLDAGTIYSEQTGHYPVTLSIGNTYIMVFYHQATNVILAELIKSRTTAEVIRARDNVYKFLTSRNFKPTYQIPDNKCSDAL